MILLKKLLIIRINKCINQAQWELDNVDSVGVSHSTAWYLIKGRLNGYNHILEILNGKEI